MRVHHSASWHAKRTSMRKFSKEICVLMTMALETRLKTLTSIYDSDRQFIRDLIVEELTGYYGGPIKPEVHGVNEQASIITYNPNCWHCRKRLGLPEKPKTGFKEWLKEKLGC